MFGHTLKEGDEQQKGDRSFEIFILFIWGEAQLPLI